MYFWQWSPKKKTLVIPEVKKTIPGIKNLDSAKKIMETFNPDDWMYVVKAKSGKQLISFMSLEAAEHEAKAKSANKRTYSVYKDGKCVSTYIAGKKLPQWKKAYEKIYSPEYQPDGKSERFRDWYENTPVILFESVAKECVEFNDDAVKIQQNDVRMIETPTGKHARTYRTCSVTYHKNRQCFVYFNKTVRQASTEGSPLYGMFHGNHNKDFFNAAKEALMNLCSDRAFVIKEATDWNELHLAIQFPTILCAIDTYHHTATKRELPYWVKENKYKDVIDERTLLEMTIKKENVPAPKSLRRLYAESYWNIRLVRSLIDMGITDVNHIMKCPNLAKHIHGNAYVEHCMNSMVSRLIKLRGMDWVAKHAQIESCEYLVDASRMMLNIEDEAVDYILKESRNFMEIHDSMQYRQNKMRQKRVNKRISYTEEELARYNKEYDHIRFELAKDSMDLAIVGSEMGICVGGYAAEAISKITTIIKMMIGKKYIACIEVRNGYVWQIKAHNNNMVGLEYKPFIDKWVNDAHLTIQTIDYERMGEEQCSRRNYANIMPQEYIHEDDGNKLIIIKAEPKLSVGSGWRSRTTIPESESPF